MTISNIVLGVPTVGDHTDSLPKCKIEAYKYLPVGRGVVDSISVYLGQGTATAIWVGIYNSDPTKNVPAILLTQGLIQNPKPNDWNEVTVRQIFITTNNVYWIAIVGVDGSVVFKEMTTTLPGKQATRVTNVGLYSYLPKTFGPDMSYFSNTLTAIAGN